MAVSVPAQMLVFLVACAVGAALGLLYDLFRIFRLIVPCGRVALALLDIFFFLLCAAATFLFLLAGNRGGIRFFLLEGELLGAVIWLLTVSRPLMRGARAATEQTRRAVRFCGERLRPPIRRLGGRVGAGLRRSAQKTGGVVKKAVNPLKMRLKPKRNMMYNKRHTWRRRQKSRPK